MSELCHQATRYRHRVMTSDRSTAPTMRPLEAEVEMCDVGPATALKDWLRRWR